MSKAYPHEACVELAEKLWKCIKENPIKKYTGVCTDYDTQLRKCVKAERARRQRTNFEEAMKRNREIKKRIKIKAKQEREERKKLEEERQKQQEAAREKEQQK